MTITSSGWEDVVVVSKHYWAASFAVSSHLSISRASHHFVNIFDFVIAWNLQCAGGALVYLNHIKCEDVECSHAFQQEVLLGPDTAMARILMNVYPDDCILPAVEPMGRHARLL